MLYHKDVYLPKQIANKAEVTFQPVYSAHAKNACKSDRNGMIILPKEISFSGSDIIEIEVENKQVVKYVIRLAYSNTCDLILVFLVTGLVKTVWLNCKSDNHSTLDKNKYVQKPIQK